MWAPQAGHMVMLWQDGQGRSAMSLMSSGPVGSILPTVPGSAGRTEDGRQDESWLTVRQLLPVLNYASAAAFVLPEKWIFRSQETGIDRPATPTIRSRTEITSGSISSTST